MIPTEITLKDKVFQNQYYVTGHYDFKIDVEYENGPTNHISRRYSEIRALYKTLILKCPGCLIPNIPSKSIWLKINYGNEEQMSDRVAGIQEFLTHIAKHKILRKNKYVINFFSSDYKRISESPSSTKNNKKDDSDDDDDDLDFRLSSDKKEISNYDNNSDDDIEPLEEFVEEYNNKNKGIVSKGKKLIGNIYSYAMSYVSSGNKNEEEKEENNINNNNNKSNVFYKKLSKEDFEFIEKKAKELGENFEIKDYNEKINRLNEGIKNIIQNFEKLSDIHKKNTQAFQNIVNNDNNYKKTNKPKIDDDEDEDIGDNNNKINHKNNIEKIKNYCKIHRNFIEQKLENSIKKIKKYQIFLQELLDIYSRKKEHISYLSRLHSQKEELIKQNSANEDPLTKKKIKELEDQLNHEIKFIKKINKDLNYEIQNYKDNQEDIYIYINSIFKDKAIYVKDCISTLNREDFVDDEEEKNEGEHKSKSEQSKKTEYCDENNGDDF